MGNLNYKSTNLASNLKPSGLTAIEGIKNSTLCLALNLTPEVGAKTTKIHTS